MGCTSSKPAAVEEGGSDAGASDGSPQHVVSLISTTYGLLLKLDLYPGAADQRRRVPSPPTRKSTSQSPPEVISINAWEVLRGLQDDDVSFSTPQKKQQQQKQRGKKNHSPTPNARKPLSPIDNLSTTPMSFTRRRRRSSSRRHSLTPIFDPKLVASFERELLEVRQQIENVVLSSSSLSGPLDAYEPLCPSGGTGAVVLYTTTLEGIRPTYEACNAARVAIEACGVRFLERDVSMDHRYRDDMRSLMRGWEEKARLPVVFVKGRLIGGAEEVLRLMEEGKLEPILKGIPLATVGPCTGCGGARFVLCNQCSGSCKVRRKKGEEEVLKCDDCNENGLIYCPICCR